MRSSSPDGFDVFNPACPARSVLEHVTSRWGVLVLITLQERTYRFAELRRRLNGVSEKVLADTLRALEQDGFIRREAYPEASPRVEYSLTGTGGEVATLVDRLVEWIEAAMPQVAAQSLPDGVCG